MSIQETGHFGRINEDGDILVLDKEGHAGHVGVVLSYEAAVRLGLTIDDVDTDGHRLESLFTATEVANRRAAASQRTQRESEKEAEVGKRREEELQAVMEFAPRQPPVRVRLKKLSDDFREALEDKDFDAARAMLDQIGDLDANLVQSFYDEDEDYDDEELMDGKDFESLADELRKRDRLLTKDGAELWLVLETAPQGLFDA